MNNLAYEMSWFQHDTGFTSDGFHDTYDASLHHDIQEAYVSIVVSTRETWFSKSFECASNTAA